MVTKLITGVRANGVTLTLLTSAIWREWRTVTRSRSGHGAIKFPVFDCESHRMRRVVIAESRVAYVLEETEGPLVYETV